MQRVEQNEERANTKEYIMLKRAADAARPQDVAEPPAKTLGAFSRPETSFRIHVLASGSKGNATIVETRENAILIDCGITKKAFDAACASSGIDVGKLRAVFVTHEHSDHTKGLGVLMRGLSRQGIEPKLYATAGTIEASSELRRLRETSCIGSIASTQDILVDDIHIQVFSTSHDAADPIGFVFESAHEGHRDFAAYLTDSGIFPDAAISLFPAARLIALEANHDPHLLDIGPYPSYLKRRIASPAGHLSNEQASSALESVVGEGLECLVAMHLSETNNTPRLVRESLCESLATLSHPAHVELSRQGMPISIG